MTAMIELTESVADSTIYVNVDKIECIADGVCGKAKAEVDCGKDSCFHVKETAQDIIKALGVQVIKVGSKVRPIYKDKRKPFRKHFNKVQIARAEAGIPLVPDMTEEVLNS